MLRALLFIGVMVITSFRGPLPSASLDIAVVGLVHGHVHGYLAEALEREDINVLAVVEARADLREAAAARYGVRPDQLFSSLDEMEAAGIQPTALTAFTNTFDHLAVTEWAAARGIHVMMEKPLAVSMDHAQRMADAADAAGIHLMVNYETTWYATNHAAHHASHQPYFGAIRKMVVHDGHFGPKEIGVGEEFLEWLTDPVLNGGGALTDFGCYGANLMSWLMDGEEPIAVTAVLQQLKSDPVYAEVDDEATILVEYSGAQGIIQASWSWPYHRKDMEVYGDSALAIAPNSTMLRFKQGVQTEVSSQPSYPSDVPPDALSYLRDLISGTYVPAPYEPSSLENNLMVTQILDAARTSAASGERVVLKP